MHNETEPDTLERSRELGYEIHDISIPVLLQAAAILAVFIVVVSAVMMGVYLFMVPRSAEQSATEQMRTQQELPPSSIPKIQSNPVADIKAFRTLEDATVKGYGHWIDGDHKPATYIPIDRAMAIVAAKPMEVEQPGDDKNDVTPPSTDRGLPSTQPGNVSPREIAPPDTNSNGSGSGEQTGPEGQNSPGG